VSGQNFTIKPSNVHTHTHTHDIAITHELNRFSDTEKNLENVNLRVREKCGKHALSYEFSLGPRDEKKRVSRSNDEVHNHQMIVRIYCRTKKKKNLNKIIMFVQVWFNSPLPCSVVRREYSGLLGRLRADFSVRRLLV